MNMVVVSDNMDICAGFRLVGVECHQADTPDELASALGILSQLEVGLIVVTAKLAARGREVLSRFSEKDQPLVVEIPD